jgi:hypothetical protein
MDSLKFNLGPPCPTLLCPAGKPASQPARLYGCFRGGPPAGRATCSCLLPHWTPHAVRLCTDDISHLPHLPHYHPSASLDPHLSPVTGISWIIRIQGQEILTQKLSRFSPHLFSPGLCRNFGQFSSISTRFTVTQNVSKRGFILDRVS